MPRKQEIESGSAPDAGRCSFNDAACAVLWTAHFEGSPEPAAEFTRDMQRWARWFEDQKTDDEQNQSLNSDLKELARLASEAYGTLERLIRHKAFEADNRLHVLEDYGHTEWLWQVIDTELLPRLSQLVEASLNAVASDDLVKPRRGAPRKPAKYDATYDLITIFEWYSKRKAWRGAKSPFAAFVVSAFGTLRMGTVALGQIQEALADHPHDGAKPFCSVKNNR